jgi:hypothetical protein
MQRKCSDIFATPGVRPSLPLVGAPHRKRNPAVNIG